MTFSNRPDDAAPGGMRGTTRMYDPSEARHDRMRRRLMNAAFVLMLVATLAQLHWARPHHVAWPWAVLLIVAGVPLGLAVKIFELRFKMAAAERRAVLRELPVRRKMELLLYGLLALVLVGWASRPPVFSVTVQHGRDARASILWLLWGVWLYDFITYYHDRPERIRHLYAVTRIMDELRQFPAPWVWTLPALAWEIFRMTRAR